MVSLGTQIKISRPHPLKTNGNCLSRIAMASFPATLAKVDQDGHAIVDEDYTTVYCWMMAALPFVNNWLSIIAVVAGHLYSLKERRQASVLMQRRCVSMDCSDIGKNQDSDHAVLFYPKDKGTSLLGKFLQCSP
jgi:hypothetical protein